MAIIVEEKPYLQQKRSIEVFNNNWLQRSAMRQKKGVEGDEKVVFYVSLATKDHRQHTITRYTTKT